MCFEKLYEDLQIVVTTMVFIFIAGCGVMLPKEPEPGIDPELVEYVERFEELAKQYYGDDYVLPPMDIDLGDTSTVKSRVEDCTFCVTVGWCRRSNKGPHKIMISNTHWEWYSDSDREQLMFHELGHCALNRMQHRDAMTPYRFPISIMNSIMVD